MDGGRNSDDGSAADLIQIEKADRANDALKLPAIVRRSPVRSRRLIRKGMKHQSQSGRFKLGSRGDKICHGQNLLGHETMNIPQLSMCFDAKKWCGQRHYSKESLQPSYSPLSSAFVAGEMREIAARRSGFRCRRSNATFAI